MAYEYENHIINQQLSNFMTKKGTLLDTKESLELKEVYAKARAFDGIRSVDEGFYKEYGYYPNEKEWWYEASNIIEKYEESDGGQMK